MYNGHDESDHDEDSLGSSFWSDGEQVDEEEEEEDSKPAKESVPEASEEETRVISDEDHDEGCSSSCDSPAPSLMTSGYGTYRPEEQDGGDDGSEAAFDQDSRGDLSDARDDEEDDGLSLCSWEPDRGEAGVQEGVDIRHTNAEDVAFENEATHVASEEGGSVDAEEEEEEERVQEAEEENDVESDESSSNRDIKFINSDVDFSRMTADTLWEGNLRPQKGKR